MNILNELLFLQQELPHTCLNWLYIGLRKYWHRNHGDCYNVLRFLPEFVFDALITPF